MYMQYFLVTCFSQKVVSGQVNSLNAFDGAIQL